MKYQIKFKTPNVLDQLRKPIKSEILDVNAIREFANKWIKCGEVVTLEFDTEANTCVVVPNR